MLIPSILLSHIIILRLVAHEAIIPRNRVGHVAERELALGQSKPRSRVLGPEAR
jgi:hypothetical protein